MGHSKVLFKSVSTSVVLYNYLTKYVVTLDIIFSLTSEYDFCDVTITSYFGVICLQYSSCALGC